MRRITAVRVNERQHITHVRGDDWPARTARHVVEDIEMGMHAYNAHGPKTACLVYTIEEGDNRIHLVATEPEQTENVLLSLPRF
jgi:hypothetical protein